MNTRYLKRMTKSIWLFSLLAGSIGAIAITSIVLAWEFLENPGGLYHDHRQIHWPIVYETAISWLLEAFIVFTLISAITYRLFLNDNKSNQFTE
ncbi:MAG: hypothetical protein CL811_03410 [Colwelliaceae bacterium]|nr:hypothetical protein [Colwelliaceae bacterium]